jgi:hypothetical protein
MAMLIVAVGGGANQGAVILISWAAALLTITLAVIVRRMKKKPLSLAFMVIGAAALAVSGTVSQAFGWWHAPIVAAAIILLPIALELYGLVLVLPTRKV